MAELESLRAEASADPEAFWARFAESELCWFQKWNSVLQWETPHAQWFAGGKINLAHNCVDRWAERTPERVAVAWEGEEGVVRLVTYAELQAMANRIANGLRDLGVAKGDTVGIFLPMAPETVAVTLACAKLGAIYLPIFSGYAAEAVATRLQGAEARVLITADGTARRGKLVPMKEAADEAAGLSPTVEHVVVWARLGRDDTPWNDRRDVRWEDLVDRGSPAFETERLDPEDPLFIAYTSGTTGLPKGSVHVHGGFLVKIAEEVAYQADLHQ